jgi:hypothetical protein
MNAFLLRDKQRLKKVSLCSKYTLPNTLVHSDDYLSKFKRVIGLLKLF